MVITQSSAKSTIIFKSLDIINNYLGSSKLALINPVVGEQAMPDRTDQLTLRSVEYFVLESCHGGRTR